MTRSHAELVETAEGLADRLWSTKPRVNRAVLLSLVSSFLQKRNFEELRRTLKAAQHRGGGHRRGEGRYSKAVDEMAKIVLQDLDATALSAEDYARLLGWVARLLYTRENLEPSPAKTQTTKKRAARGRRPQGGLDQKNLSALERFKKHLEEKEK